MRILITTGVFAPESGGPATYTPSLAARLVEAGHQVTVITYSQESQYDFDAKYPFTLIRIVRQSRIMSRVRFLAAVFREMQASDLVYTLDWFAAGLPVMIAARLRGKKYIVRIGGDYLWEQKYLESGAAPVTLADFYALRLDRTPRYMISRLIIRSVLLHAARVVFNSDTQRSLYEREYGLNPAKTATIYNPSPNIDNSIVRNTPTKEFIYWGRIIVMKNIDSLIRAFAKAKLSNDFTLTIIGDGPQKQRLEALIKELKMEAKVTMFPSMQQRDAWIRVKDARAFVLPSWTDISPNQVCEALALGIPALVTKENYLSFADQLPEMFDPNSIDELALKLEMLADDSRYEQFKKRCAAVSFAHGWDEVTRQHLELFSKI
jgi:glycosyltransferase involved in cell wall biosynthesis